MKIMVIGNAGTGKSTFTRMLAKETGYPVLALDQVWHAMDYSAAAKVQLAQVQSDFMATNVDWIIDGNYSGTMPVRLAQADVVVLLKCPRVVSIARVIRRSLRFRRDPATRPDMNPEFKEHFDRDYLDFMFFIWGYPRRFKQHTAPLLQEFHGRYGIMTARNQRQKAARMRQLIARD